MDLFIHEPDWKLHQPRGPFISYGPGEVWRIIRGAQKKTQQERGASLFHQIILVKETNILEYLVLM